jgi:hypothetical protein
MTDLRAMARPRGIALLLGVAALALAGCEGTGGTASPGIGTVAGAAAGAGAGRALFGSSPAGMLIGGAAVASPAT